MTTTSSLKDAQTWGMRFTDAPEIGSVADALLDGYKGKLNELPLVVTPNVDILVTLESADAQVKDTVARAAVVLPDGQPLVSFSRFAGDSLQARLAGSDLTAHMWPVLAKEKRSTFAVVSTPVVGERLLAQHSEFAFVAAPILPSEAGSLIDRFAWNCIEQIASMGTIPEFVYLGVGFPKDILLAQSILAQWPDSLGPAPMVLAVGASLEFITGMRKRAPEIFQRLGIEFVYRMMCDPRRLLKRYLVRDARFLVILGRHLLK